MSDENINIALCEQLARDILDPEMWGYAVTYEVRNAARRALGRPERETGEPRADIEGVPV